MTTAASASASASPSASPSAASASGSKKARVLLVDDHPIVRHGLAALINATADLGVCAEASSAREALEQIEASPPDVAVVDISLEDRNGVELIKDVVARHPGVQCLALSMYDETLYAMRVLRAGGRGYVTKQEVSKKIVTAIRQVLTGHVYVSEKMATRLVDQLVQAAPGGASTQAGQLSDREMEILMLLGRGQSNREIAEKLYLSIKTVEAHRERIKDKLKLKTAAELLRYAVQFTLDAGGEPPSSPGK